MNKELLMFADIEVEKFYWCKSFIFLENVDNEDVLVSSKIYFGDQYYNYLKIIGDNLYYWKNFKNNYCKNLILSGIK